jgi:predicted XRE-type DNA-binding protein
MKLSAGIGEALRQRRLNQAAATELLGIDQLNLSRLLRGCPPNFPVERLMYFLALLGRDVQIIPKPTPRSRSQGRVCVVRAA